MMRTRLALALAVAGLLISASGSFATGDSQTQWTTGDWPCQGSLNTPTMTTTWDWSWDWQVTPDGFTTTIHMHELFGPAPAADPDVNQTIRNRTTVAWTDWEVQLTNATYRGSTALVQNLSVPSPVWQIDPLPGNTGFTAHLVSGDGTQVLGRPSMQSLSVFFTYDVLDTGQQVSITQFPTSYYPIPEPATLASLLAGCLAFGFRLRRKPEVEGIKTTVARSGFRLPQGGG